MVKEKATSARDENPKLEEGQGKTQPNITQNIFHTICMPLNLYHPMLMDQYYQQAFQFPPFTQVLATQNYNVGETSAHKLFLTKSTLA